MAAAGSGSWACAATERSWLLGIPLVLGRKKDGSLIDVVQTLRPEPVGERRALGRRRRGLGGVAGEKVGHARALAEMTRRSIPVT